MKVIIKNIAQCKKCKDIIESKHDHDFIECSCGSIAVDGGTTHLSRTGKKSMIIELSKWK